MRGVGSGARVPLLCSLCFPTVKPCLYAVHASKRAHAPSGFVIILAALKSRQVLHGDGHLSGLRCAFRCYTYFVVYALHPVNSFLRLTQYFFCGKVTIWKNSRNTLNTTVLARLPRGQAYRVNIFGAWKKAAACPALISPCVLLARLMGQYR